MFSLFVRIQSFFLLLCITLFQLFTGGTDVNRFNNYSFVTDTATAGAVLDNVANTVNVWDMGTQFINAEDTAENSIFDFTEYIELMQCTGGNAQRDLFTDPYDTTVPDDYDFSRLLASCSGILSLGAKPWLKMGSVPMKYTSGATQGFYEVNLYPPDDYTVYDAYIRALTQALVDTFGLAEVRSWRFGVLTEFENGDWFMAKSGAPADSAAAFCELYDHTAQAVIQVLGEGIYIGAHAMTVTEGLWDEALFLEHCAKGTNYANGKTGAPISYLAVSYYDSTINEPTRGYTLAESIAYVRTAAEKYGLTLDYGVDEGRILSGTHGGASNQLVTRVVGDTKQGAYDARMWATCLTNDISWFSSWGYLSGGLLSGNPTVSYHTARLASAFAGSRLLSTKMTVPGFTRNAEINAVSAFNSDTRILRMLAYNFCFQESYAEDADLRLQLNAPEFAGQTVRYTLYRIDDNCNYFDEWREDRKTYGITDDCFFWSPDDPCIESGATLQAEWARALYFSQLQEKYAACAELTPQTTTVTFDETGHALVKLTLAANTAAFLVFGE